MLIDPDLEFVSGAGVVVREKGDVVLLSLVARRGLVRWELPAGVQEAEDTCLEDTARREAEEETPFKVKVEKVLAVCVHSSARLRKAWMGLMFEGEICGESGQFPQKKRLENSDIPALEVQLRQNAQFGTFETILASGLVNWRNIPEGRIHPQHLSLLKQLAGRSGDSPPLFLVDDADADQEAYDPAVSLFLSS